MSEQHNLFAHMRARSLDTTTNAHGLCRVCNAPTGTPHCRNQGGFLGGPVFECELPAGHHGPHSGGGLSWDR